MLTHLRNDIRYALRTLARNPGFALAAILPIALGIGLNTAIFSLLNSFAWRSLPVPDADALVSIYQDFRGGPRRSVHGARALFSIPEYRAYRDGVQTLSGLMAYSLQWTVTLGREAPQEIEGILVTCNYFDVLKVPPALGAGFTSANCGAPGSPPLVMVSHALWQNVLGADPAILQRPIVLNGHDVTVAGVAPAGFDGVDMAKAAFFAPTTLASLFQADQQLHENPHVSWLKLIGRRHDDADIAAVRTNLALIARRIDQQQPGRTTSLIVEPAATLSLPVQRRGVLRAAGIVLAAFGLLLLIAAFNVANLLLARAAARSREIAIRLSVGASRGRLIQQLLTESVIIAVAGAACGALLFSWSFKALIPLLLTALPAAEPLRLDLTPDWTVLAFALGLTAATTLVFGLVPALQASASDVQAAMKRDTTGVTGRRGWLRATLIGAQVALCTMLLIPAGLLSRALHAAYTFDPGFDYGDVVVASIDLRGPQYEKGGTALVHEQWLERVRGVPGVERIAQVGRVPLSPGRSQATFRVDEDSEGRVFDVNTVSPDFFAVVGLPLVRGRVFADGEADAALVTESTARRHWPGQDAMGRVLTLPDGRRQVVGIVRDAQVSQAEDAVSSYVYLPATRGTQRRITVLARTRLSVADFAAAVRAQASQMDATLVVNVQAVSDNVGLVQKLAEIAAGVASLVTLLAVGLASVGIYGVVAYVVARRRREIGVRIALGAVAGDVQRLFLRQTLRPVAIGLCIGIVLAAASARVLRSVLFGISPYDPVAFIGAPVLMLALGAIAAAVPTYRALRASPLSVLRAE